MVKRTPLRLCFTDTETTGLFGDPPNLDEALRLDRQIIEYAFVLWEDGDKIKRYEQKVFPTGEALADAEECARNGHNHFDAAHWFGFGPDDYEHKIAKPWAYEDCDAVEDFLTGETMAGSNPGFDLVIYKAEFHRLGVSKHFPKLATHRKLDVGQLAWPLWSVGLTEKTGLESLTKVLGVEHKAHTAMGDVLACIECFELLCDSYVGNARKLKEIAEACAELAPKRSQRETAYAAIDQLRVL